MNPIQAGLRWAGVCTLLPVCDEIPPELLQELIMGPVVVTATDGLEYILGLIADP